VKPLALALAACALAAGTAAAAPADKSAPAASPTIAGAGPKGYVVVHSALLTAPAEGQTPAFAQCPAGTVPFGGGAWVSSGDTAANLNSSVPTQSGWLVDVNNGTRFDTTFTAYAVCAAAPLSYQVIVTPATPNPAGTQSSATAVCPIGTKVLGGGGYSASGATTANINSLRPSGNGWETDMDNAGGSATTFASYAICGHKPHGYAVVTGPAVANAPGSQVFAMATCPAPSLPLSGGGYSNSGSPLVGMNTSSPNNNGNGWQVYENNAGTIGGAFVTAYAICAGTL
jgi:hypothetical protein